ncbi:MAG TPA: hypothetical protein VF407_10995 [Polyangiaceae bacterium]
MRCVPFVVLSLALFVACGGKSSPPPSAAPATTGTPVDAGAALAIWGPYASPSAAPNPSDVPYDPPPPDPTPTATPAPAASDDASQPWNRKPSAAEVKACSARGGKLQPVCMSGALECVIHYKDAGKPCKGKKDCTGGCFYMGDRPEPGTSVIGNCQATSDPCGCKTIVENGKVGSSICTD